MTNGLKIRILNRNDQLIVAVLFVLFMLSSIFYFWQRSITNGGMIDFEDMPTRQAEYLVDLNNAGWPEFANLPGIGEKLAKQIVRYRDENGPFEAPQQLINISGIGEAKLKAMLEFLSIVPDPGDESSFKAMDDQ